MNESKKPLPVWDHNQEIFNRNDEDTAGLFLGLTLSNSLRLNLSASHCRFAPTDCRRCASNAVVTMSIAIIVVSSAVVVVTGLIAVAVVTCVASCCCVLLLAAVF